MASTSSDKPASSTKASTSSDKPASSTKIDRLARLRELQLRRNEARKLNHQEVVEEDRRNKLPANWEAKKMRVEWDEEQEQKRTDCKEKGEDFDRVKLMDVQADQAERWGRQKKKKKNPDEGFSGYEQATFRQYQRLTKQMKPSQEEYRKEKDKMGESFYADSNTLGVNEHKDSDDAIDRMVTDLEKQIEKRSKYSRRRTHNEEADIDYINERNMKFNKKLERFYGSYTTEIKQNLERGTAI